MILSFVCAHRYRGGTSVEYQMIHRYRGGTAAYAINVLQREK